MRSGFSARKLGKALLISPPKYISNPEGVYLDLDKYGGKHGVDLREVQKDGKKVCRACHSALSRRCKQKGDWPDSAMGVVATKLLLLVLQPPHAVKVADLESIYKAECGERKLTQRK